MFTALFSDQPSIYDLANFILLASILVIVGSIHLRQMTHSKQIKELQQEDDQ